MRSVIRTFDPGQQRRAIFATVVAALLAASVGSAFGQPASAPSVSILGLRLVDGHILRADVVTAGLDPQGPEQPDLTVDAWIGRVLAHGSLLLTYMPPRFSVDIDLPAGAVKVGEVKIGEFGAVAPFTDNARFPVRVAVRQGNRAAAASRVATLLLPTVVVPGLMNELHPEPDDALAPYLHRGYRDGGDAPTLFWFAYPSHELPLEEAGRTLAAYVRQQVLTRAYAAKINVIGYSLGGLIARWNIQFDVDGWAARVSRLFLVGVPNEGSVLAYTYRNVPTFVPYAYFAHAPVAHAMIPTFPFWRATGSEHWSMPADAENPALAQLNARPMPRGVRVWVIYGDQHGNTPNTVAGLTESGQGPDYGPGDGVVLADSARGLPIHGAGGVAALLAPDVVRVDLGPVGHSDLMAAGADRIASALLDRVLETSLPPAPISNAPVPMDTRENGNGH